MMTTSTSSGTKLIEKTENEKAEVKLPDFDNPSAKTIEAILNFSRNLEVKESQLVNSIELIKS